MAPTSNVDKTVYILGAGFSTPAGGPPQTQLLRRIFELPEVEENIRKSKKSFKSFLVDVLNVTPKSFCDVSLEDIYTPIDRCLADGISLKGMAVQELQDLRAQMEFLISIAISESFKATPQSEKK